MEFRRNRVSTEARYKTDNVKTDNDKTDINKADNTKTNTIIRSTLMNTDKYWSVVLPNLEVSSAKKFVRCPNSQSKYNIIVCYVGNIM
jgi:hypothetical protein